MKEGAEKVELKIQAKVESLKHANEGDKGTQMVVNFVSLFRSIFTSGTESQLKVFAHFFRF